MTCAAFDIERFNQPISMCVLVFKCAVVNSVLAEPRFLYAIKSKALETRKARGSFLFFFFFFSFFFFDESSRNLDFERSCFKTSRRIDGTVFLSESVNPIGLFFDRYRELFLDGGVWKREEFSSTEQRKR